MNNNKNSKNVYNEYLVMKRLADYKYQQKLIKSNTVNSIPFHSLPTLNKFIPGIIPGIMYKVTSHSGMGKTQFTKFTFVYKPIEFAIKNNIDFTCIYISLEESSEEFIDSLFIYILKTKYNLYLERFKLNGISSLELSSREMDLINKASIDVKEYMSRIYLLDNVYKPTEIYKKVKEIALKYGTFQEHKDIEGNIIEAYEPTNKDHKFLIVTDHISLIEEEYDNDLKVVLNHSKSIAKWHTKYLRQIIAKQWKFTVVNIQQQSLESEKQQFTSKGESVINKILPKLDGVANNKEVIRDDYVVLGLFSPERYEIESFRGYNIYNPIGVKNKVLGDNFRSLHILKARFGIPNKVVPLYFDGSYNYFEELPIPIASNVLSLNKYYDMAENNRALKKI